jgi:hypothetical protein
MLPVILYPCLANGQPEEQEPEATPISEMTLPETLAFIKEKMATAGFRSSAYDEAQPNSREGITAAYRVISYDLQNGSITVYKKRTSYVFKAVEGSAYGLDSEGKTVLPLAQMRAKVTVSPLRTKTVVHHKQHEGPEQVYRVYLSCATSGCALTDGYSGRTRDGVSWSNRPMRAAPLSGYSPEFADKAVAQQVADAFSHAIALCGGTRDAGQGRLSE